MSRQKMTPLVAIRNYFGQKPGQTMQEFAAEVKQLSAEERLELAEGAARVLGVELVVAESATTK